MLRPKDTVLHIQCLALQFLRLGVAALVPEFPSQVPHRRQCDRNLRPLVYRADYFPASLAFDRLALARLPFSADKALESKL